MPPAGRRKSLEAQAFAYLAVRTLNGLPITFPHTTGIRRPMAGGVVGVPAQLTQRSKHRTVAPNLPLWAA